MNYVVYKFFFDFYDVLEVYLCSFKFEVLEFGEVFFCFVFFGFEVWCKWLDFFKVEDCCFKVELGWLVEVGVFVEVFEFEECCFVFNCFGDEDWWEDFVLVVLEELFFCCLYECVFDFYYCGNFWRV